MKVVHYAAAVIERVQMFDQSRKGLRGCSGGDRLSAFTTTFQQNLALVRKYIENCAYHAIMRVNTEDISNESIKQYQHQVIYRDEPPKRPHRVGSALLALPETVPGR